MTPLTHPRPRRLRRRVVTAATPICLVDATEWRRTHEGVHKAAGRKRRRSLSNTALDVLVFGGLAFALLAAFW